MGNHLTYEESKKLVFKGLILLGIVTLVEVAIALVGNGHIIDGFTLPKWIMYPLMIGLSVYKAYFIVYEFMHMTYEVPGLRMSVLMPCLLLVWGIIAFFQEGNAWGERRNRVQEINNIELDDSQKTIKVYDGKTSMLFVPEESRK